MEGPGEGPAGQTTAPARQVIAMFRYLLVPFVLLAVGATTALYLATSHTDDAFAWTIVPNLTAALLGAAFAGTIVFFAMALRERLWANFRMVLPAPFTLSTLMLLATLLHLDKFHLDEGAAIATAVARIWLVVYLVVPPAIVGLTWVQLRAPGVDPPRTRPLPLGLRVIVGVFGLVGVLFGLALFVAPHRFVPRWPWLITPLTARALAAWIAGLGVAALQAVWEDDLRRVRVGMAALAVLGALGLVAVARYPDDIDRWRPGGWTLVVVLALMAAAGTYGLLLERRSPSGDAGSVSGSG